MSSAATPGEALAAAIARDTGVTNERILRAFASVPRHTFVGPSPWSIAVPAYDGASGTSCEETDDVSRIYANTSVALDRSRQLFNGAPGTVAGWLDALNPQEGERAFHVGCATGYYTAILSQLAGKTGSVLGVDVDEGLVDLAEQATAPYPNVTVLVADALTYDPGPFDVAMVSTGLSEIPELWLSRMNGGARLSVPLAVPLPGRPGASQLSKGVVFLFHRVGNEYAARMIGGVIIFTASGQSSDEAHRRLFASLRESSPRDVQSLRRDRHPQSETCWLHDETWCLSRLPIGN